MIIHHILLNVPAHQKTEEERERRSQGRGEESPGGGDRVGKTESIPDRLKAWEGAGEKVREAGSGKVKAITIILLII